nr:hypothetical protein [Actinomadura sp. CNU-125]
MLIRRSMRPTIPQSDQVGLVAGRDEDVARMRVGVEEPVDEIAAVHERQQVAADAEPFLLGEGAGVHVADGPSGRGALHDHPRRRPDHVGHVQVLEPLDEAAGPVHVGGLDGQVQFGLHGLEDHVQ